MHTSRDTMPMSSQAVPTAPPTTTYGRLAFAVAILAALLLLHGPSPAAAGDELPSFTVRGLAPGIIAIDYAHSGTDGVLWYELHRQDTTNVGRLYSPNGQFLDSFLTPGTAYYYKVCVRYEDDDEPLCPDVWVRGDTLPEQQPGQQPPLPAPRIDSHEAGDTSVRICWLADYDYDYYIVDYEEMGIRNTVPPINHKNGGRQGCQDVGGLLPGRTYIFIVQGCTEGLLATRCHAWSAGYQLDTIAWRRIDSNPASNYIVADGNDLYQMHETGSIWKYQGAPGAWQSIDSNPATRIIVASGGNLYQQHDNGSVWKYQGAPGAWQLIDHNPATAEIVADGGNLYQRHRDGADQSIWKYNGTPHSWQLLDSNPATVSITAGGGQLYQRHHNGSIWRYTGTPGGWQSIDSNVATRTIVASGGSLYQQHHNNSIWKYQGRPGAWQSIDSNPASRRITADGDNLYQIHENRSIWKHQGTPGAWQFIDGNPASLGLAAGGGKLYQLHENGSIWIYLR